MKIAELSRQVSALSARVGSGPGSSVAAPPLNPSRKARDSGSADLKDEITSLKVLVQKVNKSVVLLAQESDATRKRQAAFMEEVQGQVADCRRNVELALKDVRDMKESSSATKTHLKHQCKAYIGSSVEKASAEMEALVRGEVARLDGKFQASADIQSQKQELQADRLQEKLGYISRESAELQAKVEGIIREAQESRNGVEAVTSEVASAKEGVASAKEAISSLAASGEVWQEELSQTRKDLICTQKHLIDRTRDLKAVLKKVANVVETKPDSTSDKSNGALKSAQLYNSWRSTIFTYSPRAKQEEDRSRG